LAVYYCSATKILPVGGVAAFSIVLDGELHVIVQPSMVFWFCFVC